MSGNNPGTSVRFLHIPLRGLRGAGEILHSLRGFGGRGVWNLSRFLIYKCNKNPIKYFIMKKKKQNEKLIYHTQGLIKELLRNSKNLPRFNEIQIILIEEKSGCGNAMSLEIDRDGTLTKTFDKLPPRDDMDWKHPLSDDEPLLN